LLFERGSAVKGEFMDWNPKKWFSQTNWKTVFVVGPVFLLELSFALSFPTAYFILKKNRRIGILAPFILTVNSAIFVTGYLYGLARMGNPK
jgi:hypothetical protein